MTERGRIIRDRIIGSVVLVLAALAFLPMLLDGEGVRPEVSIEALPRYEQVELAPLPEDAPEWAFEQELDTLREQLDERDTHVGHLRLLTPEAADVDTAADDLTSLGAWAVQVGSYRSAERAVEQRDRLAADGVHAFISEARDRDVTVNRVVVGPNVTRAEAEGFAIQMRSRYGVEAFVVRIEP